MSETSAPTAPAATGTSAAPTVTIAAVARDTGIGKDTLRVWERRYGFPQPERDERGERFYPAQQVARLRLIRRLLDQGHRPGRIVALPERELLALQPHDDRQPADTLAAPAARARSETRDYLSLVLRHDGDALAEAMSRDLLSRGLAAFVTEVVAPLTREVGEAWGRGELRVFEEHLYSEVTRRTLRAAFSMVSSRSGGPTRPRVLLSTFPQEPHELGLLMAEAMFTVAGCRCQSLGVQMPLPDIAAAARAHRADIVALSFSAVLNPNHVLAGLAELRAALPGEVQIWAGGSNPGLHRRGVVEGITVAGLDEIVARIAAWRERAARALAVQ
jgi:DNA-binding transcriptional MerR regulator/methylmalonyl-CoA mutase cobalamin-binding subunit